MKVGMGVEVVVGVGVGVGLGVGGGEGEGGVKGKANKGSANGPTRSSSSIGHCTPTPTHNPNHIPSLNAAAREAAALEAAKYSQPLPTSLAAYKNHLLFVVADCDRAPLKVSMAAMSA